MTIKPSTGIYSCQLKKTICNMKIGTKGFIIENPNEKSTFDFIFSLNQDFDGIVFYAMLNEISFN